MVDEAKRSWVADGEWQVSMTNKRIRSAEETYGELIGAILSPKPPKRLSKRQIEVLELMAEGLSNSEIADRLHVSSNTVKSTLHNMTGRLGTGSRAAMVAQGFRLGYLR